MPDQPPPHQIERATLALGLETYRVRLRLTEQDRREIAAMQGKSRDLRRLIGDCGDEYRR